MTRPGDHRFCPLCNHGNLGGDDACHGCKKIPRLWLTAREATSFRAIKTDEGLRGVAAVNRLVEIIEG